MSDVAVLVSSFLYIVMVLVISTAIAKTKGNSEFTRKFVHILVGNWVFFVPFFLSFRATIAIPFIFVIVNALSMKFNLISSMEREDDSFGTVYYAVAMLVLAGAGFALQKMMLPLVGLLTMAYGDGLAAIIGEKWGKKKPFAFAPNKTLLGSWVVASVGFLVSLTTMVYFNLKQGTPHSVFGLIFIALCNAVMATFLELVGKRGSDNLTLPLGTGIFTTLCFYYGSVGLVIYLVAAFFILIVAYRLHSITEDGVVAAMLTALILYTLGGPWVALCLLLFFILGSGISKISNPVKEKAEAIQESPSRRNWKQVLCNSLPACVILWYSLFSVQNPRFELIALSIFSAAAADTFGSEIGMLFPGKVYNILNGRPVPPGLSGGVSVMGILASLLGSFSISLLALPKFGLSGLAVATILGLVGSLVDSVLGASIQRKYRGHDGRLQDRRENAEAILEKGWHFVSNNTVNLLSLFVIMVIGEIFLKHFSGM